MKKMKKIEKGKKVKKSLKNQKAVKHMLKKTSFSGFFFFEKNFFTRSKVLKKVS